MVEDGALSYKIDYVTIFLESLEILKVIQIALLVKSYDNVAEWMGFAYW